MLRAAILLALADFLGPERCAETCHPAELAAWRETAHARTTSPAPRCAPCHATAREPGVTCEGCHGAGAPYAAADLMRNRELATALGLRDAKASCVRCHRAPATTLSPFSYDAAWKKIAH